MAASGTMGKEHPTIEAIERTSCSALSTVNQLGRQV
jgi:hypothetical protein